MLQELKCHIAHGLEIIKLKAGHFGHIVCAGRPCVGRQGIDRLDGSRIGTVILAYTQARSDMKLPVRRVVRVKGYALECGKVARGGSRIQEVDLKEGMLRGLRIIALRPEHKGCAALGNVLGIGIDFDPAEHIADKDLAAGKLLIGFKTKQLHFRGLLLWHILSGLACRLIRRFCGRLLRGRFRGSGGLAPAARQCGARKNKSKKYKQ